MGRPVEYTEERKAEIGNKLLEYIEETEIPIVAEFAYLNDIRRQSLYEHFSDTIKKLIDKKESVLEKMGLKGELNPTIAKFSLAQLGWSDRVENKLTTIDDHGNETGFRFVAPPKKNASPGED